MKFINKKQQLSPDAIYSNITPLENYIFNTKDKIDAQLKNIFYKSKNNFTTNELKAIKKIKNLPNVTIKPADKNLGLAILNTEDYINSCIQILKTPTYKLIHQFPTKLYNILQNTIISFKEDIYGYSKDLYNYLLPKQQHRIPRFYGIPKVHKITNRDTPPPLRPIISHNNSLLSPSARFLDHILQPLARSYSDYLHNSITLVQKLANLKVTNNILLISLDVINLFPSIPQAECLNVIHKEIIRHPEYIIINPNIITQLLSIHINNNVFEFLNLHFQQITGTAMGTAFSPTIANIYMSSILKTFLSQTKDQPILISRYIDDIFIIWPKTQDHNKFLNSLNNYHPNIKFSYTISETSVNFLDLTIYKPSNFEQTNLLYTRTFQKPINIFQYLHFTSAHPKSIFKGIIIGETIRYVRTNTTLNDFNVAINLFKTRLQKRGYPLQYINKHIKKINFNNRIHYITASEITPKYKPNRPILKYIQTPRKTKI
jgi:hypothetical protein